MRNKDDARYRALTQDYDNLADEKEKLMKRVDKQADEKTALNEVLENLKSNNADLTREVARLSAPKFGTPKSQKHHRSQSAEATTPPRKYAASTAGSAASSRASSESQSSRGRESAKV